MAKHLFLRTFGAGYRSVRARSCVRRPILALAFLGLSLAAFPLAGSAQTAGFRIQIAALPDEGAATRLQASLASKVSEAHGVHVVASGGLFKVRVGDFLTRNDALAALPSLAALGYSDAWITADQVGTERAEAPPSPQSASAAQRPNREDAVTEAGPPEGTVSARSSDSREPSIQGFRIQIASVPDEAGAVEAQRRASSRIGDAESVYVVPAAGAYKIRVGDFPTRADAEARLSEVRGLGYEDAWITGDRVLEGASGGGGQPVVVDPPEGVTSPQTEVQLAERGGASSPVRSREDQEAVARVEAPPPEEGARVGAEVPPVQPASAPTVNPEPSADPVATEAPTSLPAQEWTYVGGGGIRLDGRPVEQAWTSRASNRVYRDGGLGTGPATQVRFAYDEDAFYVATTVRYDTEPQEVPSDPADQERIVVVLESARGASHEWGVTVTGATLALTGSWRAGGPEARTSVEQRGWSAEVRIPYDAIGSSGNWDQDQWEVSVRWEGPTSTSAQPLMPL